VAVHADDYETLVSCAKCLKGFPRSTFKLNTSFTHFSSVQTQRSGSISCPVVPLFILQFIYNSTNSYSRYSSLNIVRVIKSRRMRQAEHVACMREGRGVYRVLVGRPKGKRPLGRLRHRCEDGP
jgi:hypothetical protein